MTGSGHGSAAGHPAGRSLTTGALSRHARQRRPHRGRQAGTSRVRSTGRRELPPVRPVRLSPSDGRWSCDSSVPVEFQHLHGGVDDHGIRYLPQDRRPDVDGEATQAKHEKWIEIYSFSWGASNPTTVGSGRGLSAGKVSVSSFNIMKKTEASSATLFAACCAGQHFATAMVECARPPARRRAADVPQVRLHGRDGRVDPVVRLPGGDDTPTESVSLAFAKVAITYSKQDTAAGAMAPAGNASWDLTKVTK